jgi:electron transport complex protein RnfB
MLYAVVSLAVTGLAFGALLAFAAQRFAVPVDPRVEAIKKELPSANCGGCGFASCGALAEAIAGGRAPVDCCGVGGSPVAQKIGEIMGIGVEDKEPQVARVMCLGGKAEAGELFTYEGIRDCRAASIPQIQGGFKACTYGCLGLGSCVRVCVFGAMSMGPNGLPVVDDTKCTACGKCVAECPRSIIKLVGRSRKVHVRCQNKDKGAVARKLCKVACIACKRCEKACEYDAIKVDNNLASIDYSKCTNCGACAAACPPKCIIDERPSEECEAAAS